MPLLRPEQAKALGRSGGIGLEMAALLVVGVYGGRWLDGRFATGRTFELAGLFFGIAAGFYNLVKLARQPAPAPPAPETAPSAPDLERLEALVAALGPEGSATDSTSGAASAPPDSQASGPPPSSR